jgi:hypothetical protein
MKRTITTLLLGLLTITSMAQVNGKSKVDYVGFLELSEEVYAYRETRLIGIETFNKYSKHSGTIILDTRSKRAYDAVHVAGSINLNFSDFTQAKLDKVIPSKNARILIYCNNNFEFDQMEAMLAKSVFLALNIPTFINLYGYGYKNIYELKDYIDQDDSRVSFEGTEISKSE